MPNKALLYLACIPFAAAVIATVSSSPLWAEENINVIQVESTTINDKFENKRQEPSNIAIISGEKVDNAFSKSLIPQQANIYATGASMAQVPGCR
jgi:hypothetical protein